MATLTKGKTFVSNETVTPTKLNDLVDKATISNIVNADISTTAAIAFSKLASLPGGQMLLGNASSVATPTAISGDATLSNAGALTINKDAITSAKIYDAAVSVSKIADGAITAPKLSGAQTGTAPVYGCRAFARLNPVKSGSRTGAFKSGPYTRTSTDTTINVSNHGLLVNHKIRCDFTSGTGVDGVYMVTQVLSADSFKINYITPAGNADTSGNVTLEFVAIQGAKNISSASFTTSGNSNYLLNFTIPMPDANYVITGTSQYSSGWGYFSLHEDANQETQSNTIYNAYIAVTDAARFVNVAIFG